MDHSIILTQLFAQLQLKRNPEEIKATKHQIWEIWMDSGNIEIDSLMKQGVKALGEGAFSEAIHTFTHIITQNPDFAEGWNKRSSAYFLRGDYKLALADIEEALLREPRHFGALSGMASIYVNIGDQKNALKALRQLLELIPHAYELRQQVETLQKKLGIGN